MLHVFFFAVSLLMDFPSVADALRDGARFGLINACLVCACVLWLGVRSRRAAKN
jgi:hypothetical protein